MVGGRLLVQIRLGAWGGGGEDSVFPWAMLGDFGNTQHFPPSTC